jgi:hypothetical protein
MYSSYASASNEEKVEVQMLDQYALLASVGGYLGLFLGYSGLSTLLYFHSVIERVSLSLVSNNNNIIVKPFSPSK